MREIRSSGSVRGASGDGRPYRERIFAVEPSRVERPLPSTAVIRSAGGRAGRCC